MKESNKNQLLTIFISSIRDTNMLKLSLGELGEIQIYFRKILLHQQKLLVFSVLSN